jgi:mono/diheme cytochrome c family protein
LLPFMELQGLSDEDLVAVLSYLRSLAPVRSEVRVRKINFFARFLMAQFVTANGPRVPPPRRSPTGPSVERGEYLTTHVALCVGCHTRRSRTGGYKGPRLSGGYQMADEVDPSRVLVTPNLTPDSETGPMVRWSEDQFVARFRMGRLIPGSPMPWSSFATMTDADLRSIYRYLMSIPPVRHEVGPVVQRQSMRSTNE